MIDTSCGGLNLGRLPYYFSIYMMSSHLVHGFIYLNDDDYLDEFDISAVNELRSRPRFQRSSCKPPFRISGQSVLLSYGLSESACTNTILVTPFLRATHSAMIMTGNDDVTFANALKPRFASRSHHQKAPASNTLTLMTTSTSNNLLFYLPLTNPAPYIQIKSSIGLYSTECSNLQRLWSLHPPSHRHTSHSHRLDRVRSIGPPIRVRP
jgi:hypothetical protein